MSKQANQSMVMLAVLAGVVATMQQGRCFAKVELQGALARLFDGASEAIVSWPIMTDMAWVAERRMAFMAYVESLDKDSYPAVELVYMAERVVVDMLDMHRGGLRRQLLEALLGPARELVAHVDAQGLHFDAMERAAAIVDELYAILEIGDRQFA